jgi:hypothetical protein
MQMSIEERRAEARALADEMRRALIEASSTIDGEAVEVVEPPRERKSQSRKPKRRSRRWCSTLSAGQPRPAIDPIPIWPTGRRAAAPAPIRLARELGCVP